MLRAILLELQEVQQAFIESLLQIEKNRMTLELVVDHCDKKIKHIVI